MQNEIKDILNNPNLSFKAKGLFFVFLQKYGTEFEISRPEILLLSEKDKAIATYNAIKELEVAKLLKISYVRNGGKIKSIKINLTFEPI